MKITAIKSQVKNPDRVSIFVDGVFTFSLTLSQLVEARLKSGVDITDAELIQYKKLSAVGKARVKLLNWVTLRPRSSGELRTYLKMRLQRPSGARLGVDVDECDMLGSEMITRGYVDDQRFVEWWMSRRSSQSKSVFQLRGELMQKGVAADIIAAQMSDTQNDDALAGQIALLRTRSKYKNDPDKLVTFLMRKGFRYSLVRAALDAEGE